MKGADEVHCPECDDPECMGCVLDICDTWDDEGGSIPIEPPEESK